MYRKPHVWLCLACVACAASRLSDASADDIARLDSSELCEMTTNASWLNTAQICQDGDSCGDQALHCASDAPAGDSRWSASAGVLALHRQRPASAPLFFNFFDQQQGLDAASFDFGYKPAWELSLARQISAVSDLEFRYFGGDAWSARARTVTDPADPLVINARIPVLVPSGRTIDATYGSDLHSFELNLQATPHGCVTWLVGFRYLELAEVLHADLIDPAGGRRPWRTTREHRIGCGVVKSVQTPLCWTWAPACGWICPARLEFSAIATANAATSIRGLSVCMRARTPAGHPFSAKPACRSYTV